MAHQREHVSDEVALQFARQTVDTIKETVDPLLEAHAEALNSTDVTAFIRAMHDLPTLPMQPECRALGLRHVYVSDIEPFPPSGSIDRDLHEIWAASTQGVAAVAGNQRPNSTFALGTSESEAFLAKLAPHVARGRWQPVSDRLAATNQDPHASSFMRLLTPLALLQTAFVAADDEFERTLTREQRAFQYYERDELAVNHIDPVLTEMCRAIVSGEPLPAITKSDSIQQQIIKGSFAALNRAYHIGETEAERTAILRPLMLVRMQLLIERQMGPEPTVDQVMSTIGRVLAGRESGINVGDLLDKAAMRVQREVITAGLEVPFAAVRAAEPPIMSQHGDFEELGDRGTNVAHTLLRTRAFAHALVNGIANGDFGYARIQQIGSQLYMKPLGERADAAEHRRAIEADEAAALAHAQEAAILERINSAVNLLQWEVLPEGNGGTSGPQAARTPTGESSPSERTERRLEPQRFAVLLELQEGWPYPGAKIFRSRLDSPEGRRRDGEEYYVLVLPQVMPDGQIIMHAVAECAANDNALYIIRGDMYDGIDWNDVFSQTKGYAQNKGAVWLRHAAQKQYDDDPIGTMNRFTDRVFEHLAMPIEEFWGKWMGQTAVRATVSQSKTAE